MSNSICAAISGGRAASAYSLALDVGGVGVGAGALDPSAGVCAAELVSSLDDNGNGLEFGSREGVGEPIWRDEGGLSEGKGLRVEAGDKRLNISGFGSVAIDTFEMEFFVYVGAV